MRMRWVSLYRRAVPWLSAGLLLQAGSCAIDTNALAVGLVTQIANSLISSFVFGAFNLGGP